ncbi:2,5-diamino-6-(ribosylamino)-4(3H)-pyrimidinone 5'-phosphate reductase [Candidatus Falkowbacteria bacterium]|jgi:2,5-diamino-6-(ribosylamino)-4(3H)-pyrimidinone 5'-phosphate reductase|nr:2,5-diamino-6-(ribosylamino)-4(3H)-pyrimidinone 5'-phosphate reductase [Candidatus Falkowbacteria bacterium]MBT7007207.1 2,5-diamino-6-(ribosylamino)-4(3H)-pyrimidinone 5'-phosphate reductase [Candidatus Falkowbacteria bacterium]
MKNKNLKQKRPFIYLCTGMSLDGKISSSKRMDTRITTDDDRDFLFDHRVPCDAIMMGGTTVINDDPSLTVKSKTRQEKRLKLGKTKEPTKIGIVTDIAKIKMNGDFLNKGDGEVIIFTTKKSSLNNIKKMKEKAAVFVYGKEKVNLRKAVSKLHELGIKSVMVEGGGELIYSLLKDDLVDEINLKIGDLIIGGNTAPTLCDGLGFTGKTAKRVRLVKVDRKKSYLTLKYKVLR